MPSWSLEDSGDGVVAVKYRACNGCFNKIKSLTRDLINQMLWLWKLGLYYNFI